MKLPREFRSWWIFFAARLKQLACLVHQSASGQVVEWLLTRALMLIVFVVGLVAVAVVLGCYYFKYGELPDTRG